MIPIPEELLEQFERGNVLLFVGERIARDMDRGIVVDWLAAELANRCELSEEGDLDFPEVAQAYEDDKGRHELVQFMRDQFEELGDEPEPIHHLIAGLTDCNVLVTTCLSCCLERAFERSGRPLEVVIGNLDVVFEREHTATLYKLCGSLDRPESVILTEDDHEDFFRNRANLSIVLQGYLARKTILFIGYDLVNSHFRRLYYEVTAPLDGYARRAYAFGATPMPRVARWAKRHGINVMEADAAASLQSLAKQLAERERLKPGPEPEPLTLPPGPIPECPYKLLDYYEAKDAAIFFGRQQETQKLSSLIHGHRLVLLYGASGTGKTSLLLAGVVPQLEGAEPRYEAIYVRALEDPALVIRRAVRRRLSKSSLPEDGSLVEFLDAATQDLGRTLVIILDQFEEFFVRLSSQFRAAFVAELGALVDAHDVPVKVVLSLREDWLASMSEIEERIPGVFGIRMRLLPLTRYQARQAITAPVKPLGMSYEPVVVKWLLDDLVGSYDSGAVVMPPQLQLVCNALYECVRTDERSIVAAADYKALDGAKGVLRNYLDEELDRFSSQEKALVHALLEELISAEGTKRVVSRAELNLALQAREEVLDAVLDKLVRARLLRRLEQESADGIAYELAHEYLTGEIELSPEVRAYKDAEELLRQGVKNWQRFGTLLSEDALVLIDAQGDRLHPNAEAQELLRLSVVRHARRRERVLRGVVGGLLGGALAGLVGAMVSELFRDRSFGQMVAAGLINSVFGGFIGGGIALGVSLGAVIGERGRVFALVGAAVAGTFLGVVLGPLIGGALFPESQRAAFVLPGILLGALYGLGIALSMVVAERFGKGTRSLLRALMGASVGGLVGVFFGGEILFAFVGLGTTVGLGIVADRLQTKAT
jgi:Cdc6-like AAA superfamily ATPase